MKFHDLKLQLSILALLSFSYCTVSCSDNSDEDVKTENPDDGGDNGSDSGDGSDDGNGGSDSGGSDNGGSSGGDSQGEPLEPQEQKEKLDAIACDFLKQIPASDFQNLKYDLEDLNLSYYANDYDWEGVGEWASNAFEDCREAIGQTTEREEYDHGYGYVDTYEYIYDNYKAILLASNFTGKFTAKNGRWRRTDASNLQFEIPEENCLLTLTTSGNVKKVYAFNLDDWKGYSYDYRNDITKEYYDRTQCTIGVPEKIEVTLKVDGVNLIKTTINIKLSDITSERFDIAKSSVSVTTTTELSNGYKFNFSELKYAGNNNVAISTSVSKNSKALLTTTLSSKIENIPHYNADVFADDDDYDMNDFDNANGRDTYAKVDLMGRLQLQGKITNIRKFVDYLNLADEHDDDQSTFKSYINHANSLMYVNMYFDNTSTKQASLKLEPLYEDGGYWDYSRWIAEPVIVFDDNSSYSNFEAFFNEDDFSNAIDALKKLSERYEDLLED